MVSGARKIVLTSNFKLARGAIFKYWNKRNKSNFYSRKLHVLFSAKLLQVAQFPEASIEISNDLRMVLARDYYLIFEISPDKINVLDIWDTRQNPINFPIK